MKKAPLILGALLALALFNVLSKASQPSPGHTGPRYQDAFQETRIPTPWMAVQGDYRGFDLWVAVLLSGSALWALSLFSEKRTPRVSLVLAFLGVVAALSLGIHSVVVGDNFLDHEFLARWTDPSQARWKGALWLCGSLGLVLLGLLTAFFRHPAAGGEDRGS